MIPWRQHDWQKHCLVIPSDAGDDAHAVIYAPGTSEQRTLYNKCGNPEWEAKHSKGVLYALSWWDSEEQALDALAKANKPE